jgi:hypothetical protein
MHTKGSVTITIESIIFGVKPFIAVSFRDTDGGVEPSLLNS